MLARSTEPVSVIAGHVSPETRYTDFVFTLDAGYAARFLLRGTNGWVSGNCFVLDS